MDSKGLPKVAFLGPFGTFSHQVAYNYFGDAVTYEPRPSIASVFASLSREIPFVCMPLVNSTHGAVIETLDLFRSDRWSKDAFIRDEITLKIEHCLFIASAASNEAEPENTAAVMKSIVCVYSHEQALGQCAGWLDRHIPWAKRVKTDSTAAAGERILTRRVEGQVKTGREAAICPEVCLQIQVGLRLVEKGIQDGHDNQTRFVVASYDLAIPFPLKREATAVKSRTMLRISPREDSFGNILSLLSSSTFTLRRIDRQPALTGETWADVYFIELSCHAASDLEESLPNLVRNLEEYADVATLGTW